jgi:hypothetical protein
MSTTRMGINPPEAISHEDGPFQNQMVVTGNPSPGVRFLSAESARVIGVQRCLGCTVRSQGFSPSQRFSPTRTSWLCFTPHPPLGFWSSELFPRRQPRYLSISVALLSIRQRPGATGCPLFQFALAVRHPPRPSSVGSSPRILSRTSVLRQTSSFPTIQLSLSGQFWRAVRAIQRVGAQHSPGVRLTPDG